MHPRSQKLFLAFSDLMAQSAGFLFGALVLVIYGRYSTRENIEGWWQTTGGIHSAVHFLFVGFVLLRFYVKGLYSKRLPFWDELRNILGTMGYLALFNGIVVLIAKWPFSRSLWLSSWSMSALLIPLFRMLTRSLLTRFNAWQRATVIIGTGETAYSTYKALRSEPQLGYKIVEFVGLEDSKQHPELPTGVGVRHIPRTHLLSEMQKLGATSAHLQILIALEQSETQAAGELLETLSLHLPDLHLVPSLGGLPLFGLEANHFFSHEVLLLRSRNNLEFRPQYYLKRIFDLVLAAILLVIFSPLLLIIGLRIRKTGPGVLYVPPRIGRDGDVFYCHKFRTMIPNAHEILNDLLAKDPIAKREWDEKSKVTHDPRVTSIGEFLRRTSLDELPQLWNVIKGEMSLVGPRPIAAYEIEKYGDRLAFYKKVRPGMTGLWQVSGRSDTDFDNRIHLDTWYVKNWSLWYDIAILAKTFQVVIKRKGAY